MNSLEIRFRTLPEGPWASDSALQEWMDGLIDVLKEDINSTGEMPPPTLFFIAPTSDGEGHRECIVPLFADSPEEFHTLCYEVIPEMMRDLKAVASLTVRSGMVGIMEFEIPAEEAEGLSEEEIAKLAGNSFVEVSTKEECMVGGETCEVVSFLAESQMHHSFQCYGVDRSGETPQLGERMSHIENFDEQPTIFHHNKPASQLN